VTNGVVDALDLLRVQQPAVCETDEHVVQSWIAGAVVGREDKLCVPQEAQLETRHVSNSKKTTLKIQIS